MRIKPLPPAPIWLLDVLVWSLLPLWGLPVALLFVVVTVDRWIDKALRPPATWSPWFAWRPIRLTEWETYPYPLVWLETVERRRAPMWPENEYRLSPPSDTSCAEKPGVGE